MSTTQNARRIKFVREDLARLFRDHCEKPMAMVLGDDRKVWVVTPAEADRLVKAGYTEIT